MNCSIDRVPVLLGSTSSKRCRAVANGPGEFLADGVVAAGVGAAPVGVEADAVADDGAGELHEHAGPRPGPEHREFAGEGPHDQRCRDQRQHRDDDECTPDVVRQRLHRPAEHREVDDAGCDHGGLEGPHAPTGISFALRRPNLPVSFGSGWA